MEVDNDEQLDRMCTSCRDEVTSDTKCTRCGKRIVEEAFTNPNFDIDRFNRMSKDAL